MKPTLLSFLLLLSLTVVIPCFGQNTDSTTLQEQKGLLWQISGNGLEAPSYLYGTMHASEKVAFHLSDSFFVALEDVDKIALESDPSTWMEQMTKSNDYERYNNYIRKPFSSGSIPKGLYSIAFKLYPPSKKILQRYLSRDNYQVNHLLYRNSNRNLDFQEETYLDLFIYQAAKKSNKEVVALENEDETVGLLIKAFDTDQEEEVKPNYNRVSNDKIQDAYRDGDLSLLDSFTRSSSTKNTHRYFIEERNIIMADGIDSVIQRGATLFAGVGASHLPGKLGVIRLLELKGYHLRPVTFTEENNILTLKKTIDEVVVPLRLQTFHSADGAFNVDVPGQLHLNKNRGGHKNYLCPEMTNGAFFAVDRIPTFGFLEDISPASMLMRIDSLLYENIPGDIEKKTFFEHNGFKAVDILNKTRTGNYQRSQIIITPLEIFIFKCGGIDEFVLGADVQQFFESIDVNYKNKATYEEGNGRLKASLPKWQLSAASKNRFNAFWTHAFNPENQSNRLLITAELFDYLYIEEDTFELSRIVDEFAEDFNLSICESAINTFRGYPSIYAKLIKDSCTTDKNYYCRVIMHHNRYYLAITDNEKEAEPFWESLTFGAPIYQDSFERYEDTTLLFSVKTCPQPKETNYEKLNNLRWGAGRNYGYNKEPKPFETNFTARRYTCNHTGEEIMVALVAYGKYFSTTDSTFWNDFDYFTRHDKDLYPKDVKRYTRDSLQIQDVVYADSTSSKIIRQRNILNHGALYTIYYCTDTLTEISPFAQTFFETFEPATDTFIDVDIFKNKSLSLLSKLQWGSEEEKEEILELPMARIFLFDHTKEEIDSILQFLDNVKLDASDSYLRNYLIDQLSRGPQRDLTEKLVSYYQEAYGKASIELEILAELADFGTQKDFKAIRKIIKSGDMPIPFRDYDLSEFFYALHDTLSLSKMLFPHFFDYLSYGSYKNRIFELLAELVSQGILDSKAYKKIKKRLIREALVALKREFAKDEKKDNIYFDIDAPSSYSNKKDSIYSMYKDIDPAYLARRIGSSYGEELLYLTKLMIPLYGEDKAQPFFEGIHQLKDGMLRLNIYRLFLNNDIPVPDTIWSYLADIPSAKIPTYIMLQNCQRLDLVDSLMYGVGQQDLIFTLMEYDTTKEKVEVEYIDKRLVNYQGQKGYIYFFKRNTDYANYIEYGGLQPIDTSKIDLGFPIVRKKYQKIYSDSDKEIEKRLDKITEEINLQGNRKRKRLARKRY